MRRRFAVMASCSAVSVGLLWLTELPLGVPGEWTWNRIRHESVVESLLGVVQALVLGAIYLAVAWFGVSRASRASRTELAGWLLALAVSAFGWQIAVQEAPPDGYRMSKTPWVLYYPAMSGYFFKARYEIQDTAEFLRNYEALMAEGDVLHVGTHPPGMFLFYRGLMAVTEQVPGLVPLLNWTQPESVRDGLDVIAQNATRQPGRDLTEQDRAVLWLGALLTHASVCWVLIPLFGILCWSESRETAWKVVCFWPLVPAVLVFLPKDDVLFCGLVVSFLWCWLKATKSWPRCGMAALWGAAAGALGWAGLCLSLVFLPIGLIGLVASVGLAATQSAVGSRTLFVRLRSLWSASLGGAVAVSGLIIATRSLAGLNLIEVWRLNVRNHAGFYDQYPRTMWKWLPTNAIELVFSLGVPIAVLVVLGIARCGLPNATLKLSLDFRQRRASLFAVVAVWGLLWLTGKNSGEAARLWIPLMPLAIWLLPVVVESSPEDQHAQRDWLRWLILQAVVCLLTVTRVSGFHFG